MELSGQGRDWPRQGIMQSDSQQHSITIRRSGSNEQVFLLSGEAWRPWPTESGGPPPAAQHRQSWTQSQPEDKWTCACGGSCSDELSRLESRLAAMESRLADFEALMQRSGQSQSCDAVTSSKPDSSIVTGSRGGDAGVIPEEPPSTSWLPPAEPTSGAAPPTDTAAPTSSQGDDENGTALNLIFSDDNDTCSTAWTELGSRPLNLVEEEQAKQHQEEETGPEQKHQCQDDNVSLSSCTDSFDLIRYSTQETLVHQRNLLMDVGTDAAADLLSDEACGEMQQLPHIHRASNSLLTTTMSCAERLVTPSGEYDCSRSCLEPGPPREMAGPPASVGVSRNWDQLPMASCQLLTTAAGAAAKAAATGAVLYPPRGGDTSCETATGNCAVNLVIRSLVTRVHGSGRVSADGGCVTRGPPVSFVCSDDRDLGAADLGTVSTGEQTTASVTRDPPPAARRIHRTAIRADRSRNGSDSSGGDDCQTGQDSGDGNTRDCRLCSDLMPYAHRRLNELERDGVRCCGVTSLTPGKGIGGDCGVTNVCLQRSGFSKLDTVLIAGLVLKAAGLHESEGDQAGFVRLALRRMGFECAVVIGRHFTGCICSLDSSRLLMDIGEKSCLIFSLFQLASDLSQLPSSK